MYFVLLSTESRLYMFIYLNSMLFIYIYIYLKELCFIMSNYLFLIRCASVSVLYFDATLTCDKEEVNDNTHTHTHIEQRFGY